MTDACVAPGSRSTPLALALASNAAVRVHVHIDERSAAFFALGIAKATDRPVAVLCTSGTAAANFHPAVLEAHHAHVPLIVCTADRPPELRDVGAGQAIDQWKLYGDAVRWFSDLGPPSDVPGAGAAWRANAARAFAAALGPPAGPVHCNFPYREPLVPSGAPLVDAPGRPGGLPYTTVPRDAPAPPDPATLARLTDLVRSAPRGAVVAGWGARATPAVVLRFAAAAGWPLLADPLSGLRTEPAVSTYDALVRVPDFASAHRPELVLRLGALPTTRAVTEWLQGVPAVVLDPSGAWRDPAHDAVAFVRADPDVVLAALAASLEADAGERSRSWAEQWRAADARARAALDALLDADDRPFEGRVARDVVAALSPGATLVVASSMPVRDLESFAAPRDGIRYLANRGVNGIDGFVSTVLGVATASPAPVVALLGDLCFLHDSNGLIGAARRGVDATFVVLDNDGGGIFSFLPQRDAAPEVFVELFATPHGVDLAALARVHGMEVCEVRRAGDLRPALQRAVASGGLHLLHVRTDREDNLARHRAVWAAVAAAL
jgi:2-succinyl-5-enolpyruvyl-6-hydroxy-3-cyclohexene-1-carboxylate synthase